MRWPPSYLAPVSFGHSQQATSSHSTIILSLLTPAVCPTDHAAICAHCLSRAHTNKLNQSSATGRVTCWHDGAPPCAVATIARKDHPPRPRAPTVYHPKVRGRPGTDPCWGAAAPAETDATTPRDTTRQKHDTPPTVYVDEKSVDRASYPGPRGRARTRTRAQGRRNRSAHA